MSIPLSSSVGDKAAGALSAAGAPTYGDSELATSPAWEVPLPASGRSSSAWSHGAVGSDGMLEAAEPGHPDAAVAAVDAAPSAAAGTNRDGEAEEGESVKAARSVRSSAARLEHTSLSGGLGSRGSMVNVAARVRLPSTVRASRAGSVGPEGSVTSRSGSGAASPAVRSGSGAQASSSTRASQTRVASDSVGPPSRKSVVSASPRPATPPSEADPVRVPLPASARGSVSSSLDDAESAFV
ncbi:hypothetical protein HK405_004690 [Cladochytrium tenue]|nr:hypothetical protein HK405_004690 [Cladochytrium tenue]